MIVITDVPEHIFDLPAEYTPPKRDLSKQNNIPDLDSLTPRQKEVFDLLVQYLEGKLDESIRMICLKGYAGTGKTYLITQVLKWFVLMIQSNIAMTAPTNKAVKVLKNTASFTHGLIEYCTIHKLYGLKLKRNDDTGQETFEPEWNAEQKVDEMEAIVLDETSMLPDQLFYLVEGSNSGKEKEMRDNRSITVGKDNLDDVFGRLSGGPKTYKTKLKVIFLGDPIQIPPVGKPDCIPFNESNSDEYGIHTVELTEIIRQKEGNPILDIATITRNHFRDSVIPYERKTVITEQGGVCFINAKDKDVLYRLCETYFTNTRFAQDPDFMKVIAWTNKTVNFMNTKIRRYIYKEMLERLEEEAITKAKDDIGNVRDLTDDELNLIRSKVKLPRILIGEKLIADKPIIEDLGYKQIMHFNTNDEFEVLSYKLQTVNVVGDYDVTIYKTKVSMMDHSTGKAIVKEIDILHEKDMEGFDELVKKLESTAKKALKEQRSAKWKVFFMIRDKFAIINYNYAITAHKSQGSTYENAIVIVADIDTNKKIQERNRIKYVAYTRPKRYLFIVE